MDITNYKCKEEEEKTLKEKDRWSQPYGWRNRSSIDGTFTNCKTPPEISKNYRTVLKSENLKKKEPAYNSTEAKDAKLFYK